MTLVARYKGQGGVLVQVICRDGGLHYLSLLGECCQLFVNPSRIHSFKTCTQVIRMVTAIIRTPTVILVC
jgi:hypothetical protein